MSHSDLTQCGRLDLAVAYRRLADFALSAAGNVSSADSVPGEEQIDYKAVEDALLNVISRRNLLAAARAGAARGRGAA